MLSRVPPLGHTVHMVRRGRPPLGLPTARSIRLGRELRRLREQAGLSQSDVVSRTGGVISKLSRIESGDRTISETDIAELLVLYGLNAGSARWDRLTALASTATAKEWWDGYSELVPSDLVDRLGLEDSAVRISTYATTMVPDLLQTAAYARALAVADGRTTSAAEVDGSVEIQLKRQAILSREAPAVSFDAILDEAALRRCVGGAGILAEQLGHLVEVSRQPNVTLRVLPFSQGAYTSAAVSFELYGLEAQSAAAPDVACLVHPAGCLYVEDADGVRRFSESYEHWRTRALGAMESVEFIERLAVPDLQAR